MKRRRLLQAFDHLIDEVDRHVTSDELVRTSAFLGVAYAASNVMDGYTGTAAAAMMLFFAWVNFFEWIVAEARHVLGTGDDVDE